MSMQPGLILGGPVLPGVTTPTPQIDSSFNWATVTSSVFTNGYGAPLTIRLDGETADLGIVPDTLIDPLVLRVNDRVWVQRWGKRVVIIGRPGMPDNSQVLRRVGYNIRTANLANATTDQNVNTVTLPAWVAVHGNVFRVTAQGVAQNDTAGNYTDMQLKVGISAAVGGTQIGNFYVDQRIALRTAGYSITTEYVYGTNGESDGIASFNFVVVCHPSANASGVLAATTRPAGLFVDLVT